MEVDHHKAISVYPCIVGGYLAVISKVIRLRKQRGIGAKLYVII